MGKGSYYTRKSSFDRVGITMFSLQLRPFGHIAERWPVLIGFVLTLIFIDLRIKSHPEKGLFISSPEQQ